MDTFINGMKSEYGVGGSFYEKKKMEMIGAECVKLTCELVSLMKGEPINNIPVEAFLPEREREEIL